MDYVLKDCQEVTSDDWLRFIIQQGGTYFHSPSYFSTLRDVNRYSPFALFCCDSSGRIHAMLLGYRHVVKGGLLSKFATRMIIPQAPVYHEEGSLEFLLKRYIKLLSRTAVYTEIRLLRQDEIFVRCAERLGFRFQPHYNILVDCLSDASANTKMSDSKRRQVKKAIKSGAIIVEDPSESQVIEFYSILQNLYIIKVKKPLAPLGYFLNLLRDGNGTTFYVKYLLVVFDGKVIGGIIAPVSRKLFIHEHYVAGLDIEYKDQYPSVLATWAAIEYAKKNQISFFDFMGAGDPDTDYGVREFKMKFGGELDNPGRLEYVHSPIKYTIAKKGFKILSKTLELRA